MTLYNNSSSNENEILIDTLTRDLKANGFSIEEVKEVISIIKNSEKDIQNLKQKVDNLKNENKSNDELNLILSDIFEQIRQIQISSALKIQAKIMDIKSRK